MDEHTQAHTGTRLIPRAHVRRTHSQMHAPTREQACALDLVSAIVSGNSLRQTQVRGGRPLALKCERRPCGRCVRPRNRRQSPAGRRGRWGRMTGSARTSSRSCARRTPPRRRSSALSSRSRSTGPRSTVDALAYRWPSGPLNASRGRMTPKHAAVGGARRDGGRGGAGWLGSSQVSTACVPAGSAQAHDSQV